jgi:hypothetical protein
MDAIVGRCIREPAFGRTVLNNPDDALRSYNLSEQEMSDFRALAAQPRSPARAWESLRRVLIDRGSTEPFADPQASSES